MLDPQRIAYYLEQFKELQWNDLQALLDRAKPRQIKQGEIYIDEGASSRKLAYIRSGLIRAYARKENGDEQTLLLRWEDQFFASYDTILFHRKSRFVYQAMEDTLLLEAHYDTFMAFLHAYPQQYSKAKDFFLMQMLADFLSQTESFILLSPEERYLQFIKEKPNIVQRVANKHLASLLGVTPVSLSRIRGRLSKKP